MRMVQWFAIENQQRYVQDVNLYFLRVSNDVKTAATL